MNAITNSFHFSAPVPVSQIPEALIRKIEKVRDESLPISERQECCREIKGWALHQANSDFQAIPGMRELLSECHEAAKSAHAEDPPAAALEEFGKLTRDIKSKFFRAYHALPEVEEANRICWQLEQQNPTFIQRKERGFRSYLNDPERVAAGAEKRRETIRKNKQAERAAQSTRTLRRMRGDIGISPALREEVQIINRLAEQRDRDQVIRERMPNMPSLIPRKRRAFDPTWYASS